jgi:unsaturated rhamnogalacturonyl hydrolase
MRTDCRRIGFNLVMGTTLWSVMLWACMSGETAAQEIVPAAEPVLRQVADAVLRDFPEPPEFNWGEGVLVAGMMHAWRETRDPRYLAFVRRFGDHWSEVGIDSLLADKGYCGHWGPAYAMWLLFEDTGHERYAHLARQTIAFMLEKAERTGNGGLSHFNGKPQLWVDTLAMCCPVLTVGSRANARPAWQEESIRQIHVFVEHLRDPDSGLFYHMWDAATGQRTEPLWARGNGWVVFSLVEVLREQPAHTTQGRQLRQLLRQQLQTLVRWQDPATGLWHTVVDAPDTYLETSASAMFLYGLLESRDLAMGWEAAPEVLEKAWRGLVTQVDDEGRVVGVSRGTTPSDSQGYATKVRGTYTWGTGAMLMTAAAWKRWEASER